MFFSVRNLNRNYRGFSLNNISFDLEKGEILTLLGRSGSGKTSLLRNISGLDAPDSGTIILEGRELGNLPVQKRKIGMIFQDLALFPNMTVYDNIAYGLRTVKKDERSIKRRVEELSEVLKISEILMKYPERISGGEKQRVALARSVAPDPSLLLLDEPLSSLDIPLRASVRADIKRFARNTGITMIYVTHDHGEGFYMADKVSIINNGKLGEIQEPKYLFNHPGNVENALFLGYNVLFLNDEKVAVYPKDIVFNEESPDIHARLISYGFEGGSIRYTMETEDNTIINVLTASDDQVNKLQIGDSAGLKINRKVSLS